MFNCRQAKKSSTSKNNPRLIRVDHMERIFEKKSLPLLGENMFFMINISKVSPLKINLPFQKCYACHPIENMLQTYSELPSLITNQ